VEETSAGLAEALDGLCDAETRSQLRRQAFGGPHNSPGKRGLRRCPSFPRDDRRKGRRGEVQIVREGGAVTEGSSP
jgi:hypothetical protein